MAAKESMGWVTSMKRWQKRYCGKLYTVSPRGLGVEPRTRSDSRNAANEWWDKKRAEIDEQTAPCEHRSNCAALIGLKVQRSGVTGF